MDSDDAQMVQENAIQPRVEGYARTDPIYNKNLDLMLKI